MPSRRDFELKYVNEKPEIEGPILYLVTHANSHDAPVASEAFVDHFYVLIGKQPLELLDKVFFEANGKFEVDRDDKNHGQNAKGHACILNGTQFFFENDPGDQTA